MSAPRQNKFRGLFVAIIVGIAVVLYSSGAFSLSDKGYKQLHTFAEVLHQAEENYVDKIDEKKLIQGAIRGMLMTLDPHTVYMPPDVYNELKVDAVGRFGGVGIEVALKNNWLTVVAPIEGSPADAAGVKEGDRIVRINGVSTKGVDLGEAVSMIRGHTGSRLSITVTRDGVKHPIDINMVRRVIKVPSVTTESLGDGYVYARIATFQERTTAELQNELKKASEKEPIKGLVIDLRNNPGGLLSQAIELADLFIDHGVIVSTRSRNKEVARYEAKSETTEPDCPVVLLVNGGSASASEILAGALKDYKRALLVGTQTFGKGSVQSVIELDDGSAVKITVAKYFTPSGQSIQGFGIAPDLVVEDGGDDDKTDPQREKAVEILKNQTSYDSKIKGSRKHH